MKLELRPYQEDALDRVDAAQARGVRAALGVAATGLGKGLERGTPVLRPDGSWTPVEALAPGHSVVGAAGRAVQVEGVFHRGVQTCYRVTTDDGVEIVVDADHLWTVATDSDLSRGRPWRTLDTAALHAGGVTSPAGRLRWRLPMVAPVHHRPVDLPLDPYVLGVLIADGSLTQRSPCFTPGDDAIAHEVARRLPPSVSMTSTTSEGKATAYRLVTESRGRNAEENPVRTALRDLGLLDHLAADKFVPAVYLRAPEADRRALLAGLLDCDGWFAGSVQYGTASRRLAEDVASLVRSLGGVARLTLKDSPAYPYNGERRIGQPAHVVTIRTGSNPFLLERKGQKWEAAPRLAPTRKIASIVPVEPRETVCIKVAAGDGLFVTRGHVVTHNTVMFTALAERRQARTLILAHRDELVSQAAAKVVEVWPDAEVGIVKAERDEHRAQVVVASVQTLSRGDRLARMIGLGPGADLFRPEPFDLVIVDECFPAGTLVGEVPIEDIRPGDHVPSWDEATGTVVRRRVRRVMKRRPSALVQVTLADGESIVCTPNHPLLTTSGWCPAGALPPGASVLSSLHAEDDRDILRRVQQADGADHEGSDRLLAKVRAGLLHDPVSGLVGGSGPLGAHVAHQPSARLGADAGAQPDAFGGVTGEDGRDLALHGASPAGARRERQRAERAATSPRRGAGLAHGGDRPHQGEAWDRAADALQARHRGPRADGGGGGGRSVPCLAGAPRAGRTEGRLVAWRRVARVEVLQPGGDGRYGGVCRDGAVYNLEVEGTHTYLVGSGVVAHNCHHAAADSYRSILTALRCGEQDGPFLLGVTATPDRGDGLGLDDLFEEVVFSYDILWGIKHRFLSDLRALRVQLDFAAGALKVRRGDYDVGQAGRVLTEAGAPKMILKAWQEHASDRKTLVFTPTVALAEDVAEHFTAAGVSAAIVHGGTPLEERRATLQAFRRGDVQVLANCAVLTEGYDEPSVSCVVVARPTRSRSLYVQMVGRGTRRHPGKDDCLVLDIVGASEDHTLVTIPSLFGIADEKAAREGRRTVTEVLAAREEEEVRIGKLRAEEAELFGKVEAASITWVTITGMDGRRQFHRPMGRDRETVILEQVQDDRWAAVLRWQNGRERPLIVDVDLEMAMGVGEDFARKHGARQLIEKSAAWRRRPPSERQLAAAAKWGVKPEPSWNAGQLSDAMDDRIAAANARKMERARRKVDAAVGNR